MKRRRHETPAPLTAQEAYEKNKQMISRMLAQMAIQVAQEQPNNPQKVWAAVGGQDRIIEMLQDINQYLGQD